jgi:hypothetical protein
MCSCPTRSLAATIEDDILVTPPSRYDKLRAAEGLQCARFLLRRRPQRGTPEHPLGASWQIRHLPSNVVALGDHDGMAGADPSRGFHEAPPTAERRLRSALVQSRPSPINVLF